MVVAQPGSLPRKGIGTRVSLAAEVRPVTRLQAEHAFTGQITIEDHISGTITDRSEDAGRELHAPAFRAARRVLTDPALAPPARACLVPYRLESQNEAWISRIGVNYRF